MFLPPLLMLSRRVRPLLLAGCMAVAGTAYAQRGGGGRPMGGGAPMGGNMPMGGQPGGMGMPNNRGTLGDPRREGNPPSNSPDQAGTVSTMRGGLQLGPPGRWWDDKHFAKDLKLRSDQQKRMDSIFEQNRPSLLKRYDDLRQEETRMEDLTHGKTLDENALLAQIDRLAHARAELEKANTHYLFQIRNEMDPDQIGRLEQHR